jgi:hypothetical protein
LENSQWPAKSVTQRSATAWGEACRNTSADVTATSFSSLTVTRRFCAGADSGDFKEVWAKETWVRQSTRKIETAKPITDVRNRWGLGINGVSIFAQAEP